MMRLLVVASILAIGSAAPDGENSIFSSRYLNSLEQANNADNTPSSSSFHHASSSSLMMDEMVGEYESSRQADEFDSMSSHEQQRRELSWWSIALQFVHPPCPPHDKPQPPHCQHHHHKSSSHSSSSSSSSSHSSGGGGGGSGSWGTDGWGGDEWGSDTWGSDGHTQKSFLRNPGSLGFWMLIAAACAAAIAVGAIIVGSRRKAKEQYHPLKGSMERRMRLFGGLADRCFEDRELCGAQQQGDKDLENSFEISERGNNGGGSAYKQMV